MGGERRLLRCRGVGADEGVSSGRIHLLRVLCAMIGGGGCCGSLLCDRGRRDRDLGLGGDRDVGGDGRNGGIRPLAWLKVMK